MELRSSGPAANDRSWLGVVIAVVDMLTAFFAIGAYATWAIITIVIDGVVIYGLTAGWETAS